MVLAQKMGMRTGRAKKEQRALSGNIRLTGLEVRTAELCQGGKVSSRCKTISHLLSSTGTGRNLPRSHGSTEENA